MNHVIDAQFVGIGRIANGLSGSKAGTRGAGLQRGLMCVANAAAGVSSLDLEWAQAQNDVH